MIQASFIFSTTSTKNLDLLLPFMPKKEEIPIKMNDWKKEPAMTKADTYLYNDIHNILENGYKDVDPRPKYADGTPAYTISVNQILRKFVLQKIQNIKRI